MHHTLAVMSFIERIDVGKNKKGGNQETPLVFLYCCEEENCGLILHVKVDVKCDTLVDVFCVVVGVVTGAFVPKNAELFLGFTIFEPVETHF